MGTLTRKEGWEALLDQEIDRAAVKPFQWGEHDCALWAFGVVETLTGEDIINWRGKYSTELGAKRYVSRHRCATVHEFACDIMGPPLETPLLARRGDLVLSEAFGVVIGGEAAFLTPEGMVALPLDPSWSAWRV